MRTEPRHRPHNLPPLGTQLRLPQERPRRAHAPLRPGHLHRGTRDRAGSAGDHAPQGTLRIQGLPHSPAVRRRLGPLGGPPPAAGGSHRRLLRSIQTHIFGRRHVRGTAGRKPPRTGVHRPGGHRGTFQRPAGSAARQGGDVQNASGPSGGVDGGSGAVAVVLAHCQQLQARGVRLVSVPGELGERRRVVSGFAGLRGHSSGWEWGAGAVLGERFVGLVAFRYFRGRHYFFSPF